MRVVLDTNLYVSYLLNHRPPIATLIDVQLKSEDFSLLTAFPTLVELEQVLRYPKFQDYITEAEGKRFLALVRAVSEMVDLPDSLPRPR
jgi:putative PIN family toxin of toxin-antitoxin system